MVPKVPKVFENCYQKMVPKVPKVSSKSSKSSKSLGNFYDSRKMREEGECSIYKDVAGLVYRIA